MKKNIEIRGFNMKKNIEITGEIADVTASYVGIRLHICDEITDFFAVDTKEKEIITRLNATTKILLNVEHTFEDYMKLITDLGLEIPGSYKKHWTPTPSQEYYTIDILGDVQDSRFYNSDFSTNLLNIYNIFPTRELAEKATNVSKLERLMLLWQYANDCLFTPDWKDGIQQKYYIIYDSRDKYDCYDYSFRQKSNNIHFETSEQAKAFIKAYDKEIKKIMGGDLE